MGYYCYVLELANWQWYYWSTSNLSRRIVEHNRGKTKSIKKKLPCHLLYFIEFGSLIDAKMYEIKLKRAKNKKYIQTLFEKNIG